MNKRIKFISKALFFLLVFSAIIFFGSKKTKKENLLDPKNQEKNELLEKISMNFGKEIEPPFEMPAVSEPSFLARVCDISNHGAVSDGKTLNTSAFIEAISECSENGGGRVNVGPGVWLSGPIHLKSNIDLHLEAGAEIKFSPELKNYLPAVFSRFEGVEYYNYSPFIYARDAKNIAVTGKGKLNGQENLWMKNKALRQFSINEIYKMARNNVPVDKRDFGKETFFLQPSFMQFVNSEKILIEGIEIINSPNWNIHPIYSKDIIIRNVAIDSSAPNTDGIVIDSSENVIIENSKISSGDDAIAIKSGADQDGLRVGKPSENIIIKNSQIDSGHSALAIGSEMSGGVRNVFAYNLDIDYVDYGIRMKSLPGRGGIVEKFWAENIKINRAKIDAIRLDLLYRKPEAGYEKKNLPIFRDISIKDLYCRKSKNAAVFIGLPESPLENIILENIEIYAANSIVSENLASKNFKDVTIITKKKIIQINE